MHTAVEVFNFPRDLGARWLSTATGRVYITRHVGISLQVVSQRATMPVMTAYAWREHSFDADPALSDQTTLTFLGPNVGGTPSFSVTVARDDGAGALKPYVDGVLRELVTAMPGFRLLERDDKITLAGRPAVRVMTSTLSPDLGPVTQIQGYGDAGSGVVIVITATAPVAHEDAAKAAFSRLWTSWRAR